MRPTTAMGAAIAATAGVVAAAWLVAAVPAAAQEGPSASATAAREVELLEIRLVEAIATLNLEAYDQLVADDYVVVNASGQETTKAEVMASYRAATRGYKDLRIGEVRGHVFGDTGLVSARTFGSRVEGGREIPNRVRYVRVWARRDGRWRAVAQMATPLPE